MIHVQTDAEIPSKTPRQHGAAQRTDRERAMASTCEAVLAAAKAQFEASGYERTTIRTIASTAGFSTGAVFTHFASKADLYSAVFGHAPLTPEDGRALRFEVEELRQALNDASRTNRV